MSQFLNSNPTNAKERELGQEELWNKGHWTQKASTIGANIYGVGRQAAFGLAQPVYLVWGFILTAIMVGIVMLIGLVSDTWYNAWQYKLTLAIIPIGMFILTFAAQWVSNMGKDGPFIELLNNYCENKNSMNYNAN